MKSFDSVLDREAMGCIPDLLTPVQNGSHGILDYFEWIRQELPNFTGDRMGAARILGACAAGMACADRKYNQKGDLVIPTLAIGRASYDSIHSTAQEIDGHPFVIFSEKHLAERSSVRQDTIVVDTFSSDLAPGIIGTATQLAKLNGARLALLIYQSQHEEAAGIPNPNIRAASLPAFDAQPHELQALRYQRQLAPLGNDPLSETSIALLDWRIQAAGALALS